MDRALSGRSLKLPSHYHNDKLRRRRCLGADANANSSRPLARPTGARRGSFSHSNGRIGKVAVPGEPRCRRRRHYPKDGCVHARLHFSAAVAKIYVSWSRNGMCHYQDTSCLSNNKQLLPGCAPTNNATRYEWVRPRAAFTTYPGKEKFIPLHPTDTRSPIVPEVFLFSRAHYTLYFLLCSVGALRDQLFPWQPRQRNLLMTCMARS